MNAERRVGAQTRTHTDTRTQSNLFHCFCDYYYDPFNHSLNLGPPGSLTPSVSGAFDVPEVHEGTDSTYSGAINKFQACREKNIFFFK